MDIQCTILLGIAHAYGPIYKSTSHLILYVLPTEREMKMAGMVKHRDISPKHITHTMLITMDRVK